MKVLLIIIIILFILLFTPIVYYVKADINLLCGKAQVLAKIFGITIIKGNLSLEYDAKLKYISIKGKESIIKIIDDSEFMNFLDAFISIMLKKIIVYSLYLNFIFGSIINAASVGLVCSAYMTLINTLCAINYNKLKHTNFDIMPLYTENAIKFNFLASGHFTLFQIISAIIKALTYLIIKNKKAVTNNELK
ncbi:MAG: hypothetical protein WCX32_02030 [Clostridia bacterium]|jgi:hypothetical protein|nr:hypothetical protein [Clostridia bacterium]MDD4275977.1 hypothetical protein [Clostridia bacterium]